MNASSEQAPVSTAPQEYMLKLPDEVPMGQGALDIVAELPPL